jgi:hypothetical protein
MRGKIPSEPFATKSRWSKSTKRFSTTVPLFAHRTISYTSGGNDSVYRSPWRNLGESDDGVVQVSQVNSAESLTFLH